MLNNEDSSVFLLEALQIIASYFFSITVELAATPIGLSTEDLVDETTLFLRELEFRHSIACAMKLKDVLVQVEREISNSRTLVRKESKGIISGRIDIPRYIARRSQNISFPRTYPLLVSEETPQTPENSLVAQVLRKLVVQLEQTPFSSDSAEAQISQALYNWILSRIHRWPWSKVQRLDAIDRLQRETTQRIRKRQTGNEFGYTSLLDWIAEWQVDVNRIGSAGVSTVAEGLLAFPQNDFFHNKVFEIWCLREIALSFQRSGCVLIDGPFPLHKRSKGPIYRFRKGTSEFEIWFQRQFPLGSPRWSYLSSTRDLTGIPDIAVTGSKKVPLVVDAKFRQVTTNTRSEETYKMLGYAENFRDSFELGGFQGTIVFIGTSSTQTVLVGPDDGRLTLIVVESSLRTRPVIETHFDGVIKAWLGETN